MYLICIYVYLYLYLCVSVSVSISICLYIYLHLYLSISVSICTCIYLHLYRRKRFSSALSPSHPSHQQNYLLPYGLIILIPKQSRSNKNYLLNLPVLVTSTTYCTFHSASYASLPYKDNQFNRQPQPQLYLQPTYPLTHSSTHKQYLQNNFADSLWLHIYPLNTYQVKKPQSFKKTKVNIQKSQTTTYLPAPLYIHQSRLPDPVVCKLAREKKCTWNLTTLDPTRYL